MFCCVLIQLPATTIKGVAHVAPNNEEGLKEVVAVQPVAVGIKSSEDFYRYESVSDYDSLHCPSEIIRNE